MQKVITFLVFTVVTYSSSSIFSQINSDSLRSGSLDKPGSGLSNIYPMPKHIPDKNIDYKILEFIPDSTIDYEILKSNPLILKPESDVILPDSLKRKYDLQRKYKNK